MQKSLPLFDEIIIAEAEVELPTPTIVENMKADYALTGTTLGAHPMSLLRPELIAIRAKSSRDFTDLRHGQHIKVIGIVTGRQRPSTAAGVTFVTLEDEHGMINVIVWRDLAERQRSALMHSRLLQVKGRFEDKAGVRHLIAGHLKDVSKMLDGLDIRSRDFH